MLVAAGRKAKVNGLGLEAAGIACTPKGITVDARLRTTNKKVFAIGDVVGRYPFTHMAGYHGGIVIRNAVFNIPAKAKEHGGSLGHVHGSGARTCRHERDERPRTVWRHHQGPALDLCRE
jgi:hypothetical protein